MKENKELAIEAIDMIVKEGGQAHLALRDGQVIVVKRFPSVKERPDLYLKRERLLGRAVQVVDAHAE